MSVRLQNKTSSKRKPPIESRYSEIWASAWQNLLYITKTCLCNFDPLKPHFYIVKLGFKGVYIVFHISAQKHRLWVLVRTASSYEKFQDFLSENFHFLVLRFSVYLNRHVFVMKTRVTSLYIPQYGKGSRLSLFGLAGCCRRNGGAGWSESSLITQVLL